MSWLLGIGALSLGSGGCLLSDPPQYQEDSRTPPFLDAVLATPPPTKILTVEVGESHNVNVPFRSDDAGVKPVAILLLNYGVERRQVQQLGFDLSQPPSTLEDRDRSFSITWTVPAPAGCQQLTLVATHADNLGANNIPLLDADTAQLTWWVDVLAAGLPSSATLESCPAPTDPGADR